MGTDYGKKLMRISGYCNKKNLVDMGMTDKSGRWNFYNYNNGERLLLIEKGHILGLSDVGGLAIVENDCLWFLIFDFEMQSILSQSSITGDAGVARVSKPYSLNVSHLVMAWHKLRSEGEDAGLAGVDKWLKEHRGEFECHHRINNSANMVEELQFLLKGEPHKRYRQWGYKAADFEAYFAEIDNCAKCEYTKADKSAPPNYYCALNACKCDFCGNEILQQL